MSKRTYKNYAAAIIATVVLAGATTSAMAQALGSGNTQIGTFTNPVNPNPSTPPVGVSIGTGPTVGVALGGGRLAVGINQVTPSGQVKSIGLVTKLPSILCVGIPGLDVALDDCP
jgi:hypothetical protein